MSVKPPTSSSEESMEFSTESAELNAGSVKPPTISVAAMSVEASFSADEDGSVKPPTEG